MLRIIVLSFFVFIAANIYSQRFEGLFVGGMTATQIDGDGLVGFNKIGGYIGFHVSREISPLFTLQSGINYVGKGSHSSPKAATFVRIQLDYVEVPTLITLTPFKRLDFTAGLTFGYLIRGVETGLNVQIDNLRKFELAYHISLNYWISEQLAIQIINNYDILPVTDYNLVYCWRDVPFMHWIFGKTDASPCWWNNGIRIGITYRFLRVKDAEE